MSLRENLEQEIRELRNRRVTRDPNKLPKRTKPSKTDAKK